MPARHGAHPNHSKVKTGTKFLPPILKNMGYHIASFGKIAHGNKKFEGLDFNEPKKTDMCVEVEKYFKNNKIEGPICLLVGDRRPHVEWTKEMNFDLKKVSLPSFFIDTKETREHWAGEWEYVVEFVPCDGWPASIVAPSWSEFPGYCDS